MEMLEIGWAKSRDEHDAQGKVTTGYDQATRMNREFMTGKLIGGFSAVYIMTTIIVMMMSLTAGSAMGTIAILFFAFLGFKKLRKADLAKDAMLNKYRNERTMKMPESEFTLGKWKKLDGETADEYA